MREKSDDDAKPQSSAVSAESGAKLARYASELVQRKRQQPGDDVFDAVIRAELPGEDPPRLTDSELVQFFLLLFAAGRNGPA